MWSYKLFRIGALVLALLGCAHLLVHFANNAAKPANGTAAQLREVMYGYKENIMGTMRSQGEIFDGLTLGFSVFMLTVAAIGFTAPVQRKTAIVISASLLVMLVISLAYWFILPTVMIAAGLLCFAGSAYLDR
ncbi:MAG: hypothetical protein HYX27_25160 [Acidobacteria bacterium]|nr:hypothetical protein [Acidobacteriota bacterium]